MSERDIENNRGQASSSSPALQNDADLARAGQSGARVNERIEQVQLPTLALTNERQQEQAFRRADANRDGAASDDEMDRALRGRLSDTDRALIAEMRANSPLLRGLSSGETRDEVGITRSDMQEHRRRQFEPNYERDLQLGAERARLTELARKNLSPADFEKLHTNMAALETRLVNKPGELENTYRQLQRLLSPQQSPLVDEKRLQQVALDAIEHAANPKTVEQGPNSSCAVAALESRIYTRYPSEAVRLVADAATKGGYTSAFGRHVALDRDSISVYPDHLRNSPPPEGERYRSHASQIFQVTAANLFHELGNESDRQRFQYVIEKDQNGMLGEKLYDRRDGSVVTQGPGITVMDNDRLMELNAHITGREEKPFVIDASRARTPEEFNRRLADIQRDDNYPALVTIIPFNAPFDRFASTQTPYHALTISPGQNAGELEVNNQWGPASDMTVSNDTLYRALRWPDAITRSPGALDQVLAPLIEAEKNGTVNRDTVRVGLHQFTPEQLKDLGKRYRELTGRRLSTLISRYLPEEDARILNR